MNRSLSLPMNLTSRRCPMLVAISVVALFVAVDANAAPAPQGYDQFIAARQYQLRGEYDAAAKQFALMKSPLLQLAAHCEIARGYLADHKYDDAAKELNAVITAPANLYQGEAHYLMARVDCWRAKTQQDFQAIAAHLKMAMDFCGQDFGEFTQFNVGTVDADAMRELAGPARYDPTLECASTIPNPVSVEWYLPRLKAEILLLRIYVASQLNDGQAVADATDALRALANQSRYVTVPPAVLARLQSEGTSGSFVVPPKVWAGLSGSDAPAMRFALFLAVSGPESNGWEAQATFESSDTRIEATGNTGGGEEWAVTHIGLAMCYTKLNQTPKAITKLQRFASLFRRSAVAEIGQLALANTLTAESQTYLQAVRLYHEIADGDPNAVISAHAMLCLMIAAADAEDYDQVMAAANFIYQHHAGSDYATVARKLVPLASGGRVIKSPERNVAGSPKRVDVIELPISMAGTDSSSGLLSRLPDDQLLVFHISISSSLPQSSEDSRRFVRAVGIDHAPLGKVRNVESQMVFDSPVLWRAIWDSGNGTNSAANTTPNNQSLGAIH